MGKLSPAFTLVLLNCLCNKIYVPRLLSISLNLRSLTPCFKGFWRVWGVCTDFASAVSFASKTSRLKSGARAAFMKRSPRPPYIHPLPAKTRFITTSKRKRACTQALFRCLFIHLSKQVVYKLLRRSSRYAAAKHFPLVRLGYYLLFFHSNFGVTRRKRQHHLVKLSS